MLNSEKQLNTIANKLLFCASFSYQTRRQE